MMNKLDDHIRSFGMSGLLICDDIRGIEQRFGISLAHVTPSGSQSPDDYYPQFERSVRNEASEMARHYEMFYCLEKAIRKLISETLQDSDGAEWWDKGRIPSGTVQDVKENIQREVDNGVTRRSDAAIDYTTFGQLSGIITSNWDLFGTIFKSRRAVEKVMASLNMLRGPIAHCCPLAEDEVDRLQLAVKDWFRMIG
ncbi:MAG TPA: Swt1 family HEPN domain-containing protein [Bryobacteraceae bacterium]|nr:Swt1 family HEPN domain-containing protein [Bryobacteraceae bacterium]